MLYIKSFSQNVYLPTLIENNKHYIVDSDGKTSEVVNIPISTYLGEGQFILVDEYNNFKWAYPYKAEDNEYRYKIY